MVREREWDVEEVGAMGWRRGVRVGLKGVMRTLSLPLPAFNVLGEEDEHDDENTKRKNAPWNSCSSCANCCWEKLLMYRLGIIYPIFSTLAPLPMRASITSSHVGPSRQSRMDSHAGWM